MKQLFSMFTALWLVLSVSPAVAAIGPVKNVTEGVYTAQSTAATGETVYLGMERLDTEEARLSWHAYRTTTDDLTGDSTGWLYKLGTYLSDPQQVIDHRFDKPFVDMNDDAFDQLVNMMVSREIFPKGQRWDTFNGIRGGLAGFWPLETVTFVAYISKTPITGRLPLVKARPETVAEVQKYYGHILMSVGITLSLDLPIYEDRGIYRNPLSLIEGGYGNIATLLHCFAGKVIKTRINKDWPGAHPMEFMLVRALPEMRKVLEKDVGVERIKYADEIKAISPDLIYGLTGGYGMFDTPMLVKLDDVAALHKDEVAKPAEQPKQKNSLLLQDSVRRLVKTKGEIKILLAPAVKNEGRVLVWFAKKQDATSLSKLVSDKKVQMHEMDGGYAIKIGSVRMKALLKKDAEKVYAGVLKELGA